MIIQCGKNRRIKSYTYGWKIERLVVAESGKNIGQQRWDEDSPAYPSSLANALEAVLDRTLKESPDCDVSDLPEALKVAYHELRSYMVKAREAA
jgi:hypothetical protein